MATVTVDSILKRVNTLLNDRTWVRWPKQELLDYYNDAAKAIVLMRPDAHTKNVQFNCAAGTKQSLPADALRLIEVLRNADGKVIRFVPRRALDDSYPDWHAGKDGTSVAAYTYDDRDPKNFYLYPGPAAAVKVDVIYSVAPQSKVLTDVENVGTPALADLDDIYINPLIDSSCTGPFRRTPSTAPTPIGLSATTTPTYSSWVKRPRLIPTWSSASLKASPA